MFQEVSHRLDALDNPQIRAKLKNINFYDEDDVKFIILRCIINFIQNNDNRKKVAEDAFVLAKLFKSIDLSGHQFQHHAALYYELCHFVWIAALVSDLLDKQDALEIHLIFFEFYCGASDYNQLNYHVKDECEALLARVEVMISMIRCLQQDGNNKSQKPEWESMFNVILQCIEPSFSVLEKCESESDATHFPKALKYYSARQDRSISACLRYFDYARNHMVSLALENIEYSVSEAEFDEFKKLVSRQLHSVPKVKKGMFAGMLPRNYRLIQQAIHDGDSRKKSVKETIYRIADLSKFMGSANPIRLAAKNMIALYESKTRDLVLAINHK